MNTQVQTMEQYAAALQGLAITAGGSALNRVLAASTTRKPLAALRDITRLLEKAEKATTCMVIAEKAQAEGDTELAERSWQHALETMNTMAVDASLPLDMPQPVSAEIPSGKTAEI
jgi:hypothetical protein